MPKIDIANLETDSKTGYPEPFRQIVLGRVRERLGNAAGLTQFGVNLTTLKPGAASAQRHWHAAVFAQDHFAGQQVNEFILGGEVVMGPGDAAGFKAGVANGHCLINRSENDAIYLEVGTRAARERAEYPDIDLRAERDESGMRYLHKSGEPYRGSER
jgi:uncharacterized cupin superfamily protein